MFFFEKKNQKTFMTLRPIKSPTARMPSLRAQRSNPERILHTPRPKSSPAQSHKSLFASFSSEKEESFP
jgi:hypothetical protein